MRTADRSPNSEFLHAARVRLLPALLLLLAVAPPQLARAEVIAVTTEADVEDGDTSSIQALLADPGPDGAISLREAIRAANNTPGTDDVTFLINGTVGQRTIQVGTTALPQITDPIRIVGTCSGKPCVRLRGPGGGFPGLEIATSHSVIEGLLLVEFGIGLVLREGVGNVVKRCYVGVDFDGQTARGNGEGIQVQSGGHIIGTGMPGDANVISGNSASGITIIGSNTTGNVVQGNYIGTNADGTTAVANGEDGVWIRSSPSNTIGGTSSGARNVISGNTNRGVRIEGTAARFNEVLGNYIGVNATGNAPIPNGQDGVIILQSASLNVIGGTTEGARNVISGNQGDGVEILGADTEFNRVRGNYIGTNADGTTPVANGANGVLIFAPNNTVGGTGAGARNVISGNTFCGISIGGVEAVNNQLVGNYIGVDQFGSVPLPNKTGVAFSSNAAGNTVAQNVISGNTEDGVQLETSVTGNAVETNFIGTDASGMVALANGKSGVRIVGASGNTIGGLATGAGNVIAGNAGSGIVILSDGINDTTGNLVLGNYIGTDATGMTDLANGGSGVHLIGTPGNTVGGTTPAARNVISGNAMHGVLIEEEAATGNVVLGNYVGTSADGMLPVPNEVDGVLINFAPGNTIGGEVVGARNVIGANLRDGVRIEGGLAVSNRVVGNFIGTNLDNANLGNGDHGVRIVGARDNVIGIPGGGGDNTIGMNTVGIGVSGALAGGTLIQNNYIGVTETGADVGNVEAGVSLSDGATFTSVGGPDLASGNAIAFNGGPGVVVEGAETKANAIRRNRVYGNGALGIDLAAGNEDPAGVTANDAGDGDAGPNALQNFPVLSAAMAASDGLKVQGVLNSAPNTAFALDFYATTEADPSGYGEGRTYVGSLDVTTDASGQVAFTFETTRRVTVGHVVSATATDPDGNTSEFSAAVEVVDDTPSLTVTFDDELGDGDATNPVNWDTDDLPTGNDTAVIPAGSTARVPAGEDLQVRQLDVFGAVGSPTTFELLGALTAQTLRQFAFTTVEMKDGGQAVVETTTNTGGTTRLSNGSALTSQQGTGSYAVTSGGRIEVDGAGNAMDVNVATTNATISITPGSELDLQRESILNAITRIFNENPSAGEATVNLNGATTVAGNTDLCEGVALKNMGDLTLGANVRDCNDDGGWVGNFNVGGELRLTGNRTITLPVVNHGVISIPAGSSLTMGGGATYNPESLIYLDGTLTHVRPFGTDHTYTINGASFIGLGTLVTRAETYMAGVEWAPIQDIKFRVHRAEPCGAGPVVVRVGDDLLELPNVTVAGQGCDNDIDGGNPTPDPNVSDVFIYSLGDDADPNVASLGLANGTFDVWSAAIPSSSSFTHTNLTRAILYLSGPSSFDDFFEVRNNFADGTSLVHISAQSHQTIGNEASVTYRVPVTVERIGSQYGRIGVGPNAALGLRAGGNFQGGDDQLTIEDGGWVAVGAEQGSTSTVNFSTVPKGSGEVWINPNGEVRFSAERTDALTYLNGGTILPSNGVVYTRPFRYASGQNLAPGLYLGGLITDGPNDYIISTSSTVGEGGTAEFNTGLGFDPGASLTFGFGSIGAINGFSDIFPTGSLREGRETDLVRSVIATQAPTQVHPEQALAAVTPVLRRRHRASGIEEDDRAPGHRRGARRVGLGTPVEASKGGDAALVIEAGGIFSKTGGGETEVFVPVANGGMWLAEEGTVVVHDVFDSPGLLGGAGTFDVEEGTVVVAGPVSPGLIAPAPAEERVSTLTWIGGYGPEASSDLFIELLDDGGPGVGHDVLHVEGDVTLAGSLRVVPLGPTPPGDYPIVTFTGTFTGAFDAPDLPDGASLLYPSEPEGTPGAVILRTTLVLPPVELAAFEAVLSGADVELAWRTESETNNAGFEVQRRTDDEDSWAVIGFVEGHGTTTEAHVYRYADSALPFEAGTARYRLKQVDFDGAFEYSPEVEVTLGIPTAFALHANFPNPFNPTTTIRYEVPIDGRARLVVYDVLGRAVAVLADGDVQAGRHEVRFDASGLASGFYVYRLESEAFTQARRMMLVK